MQNITQVNSLSLSNAQQHPNIQQTQQNPMSSIQILSQLGPQIIQQFPQISQVLIPTQQQLQNSNVDALVGAQQTGQLGTNTVTSSNQSFI